ncbi:hypothetical protein F442_04879, partial [Phytophthora nicotianae P10297]
ALRKLSSSFTYTMNANEAHILDSELAYYARSLTRGVTRNFKDVYLLQRWIAAQGMSRHVEVSALFAELSSGFVQEPRVRVPFNLNALSDIECQRFFRFDKAELCILVDIMQIPEVITRERTHATATEALCVDLYRRLC